MSRYWTQKLLLSSLSDVHAVAAGAGEQDRSLNKSEAELETAYGGGRSADGSGDAAITSSLDAKTRTPPPASRSVSRSGALRNESAYTAVFGGGRENALSLIPASSTRKWTAAVAGGSQYADGVSHIEESKYLSPGTDFNSLRCKCGQAGCTRMQLRYYASLERMNRTIGVGGSGLYAGPQLNGRFVPLGCDAAARAFLYECYELHSAAGGWFNWKSCLRPILGLWYAHTDLNAILLTGQMHLLSTEQLKTLLLFDERKELADSQLREQQKLSASATSTAAAATDTDTAASAKSKAKSSAAVADSKSATAEAATDFDRKSNATANGSGSGSGGNALRRRRLLDIGAGNGRITQQVAALCDEVVCTEVSYQMVKRLRARGYTAYQTDDIKTLPSDGGYDIVCLFNVLDRCMSPLTLLRDIHSRMRDHNSRLIVATPLPLRPSVELGHTWVNPKEKLDARGLTEWEDAAVALTIRVFERAGFRVQCFSRVPYLSQGDNVYPFYVLDDAVFVLSSNHKTGYTATAASGTATGAGVVSPISTAAAALAAAAFDTGAGSTALGALTSSISAAINGGGSGDDPGLDDLPPLVTNTRYAAPNSNGSSGSFSSGAGTSTATTTNALHTAEALADALSHVSIGMNEPRPPESFDLPLDMTMSLTAPNRAAAAADASKKTI